MTNRTPADHSNGYEAISGDFMSIRNDSAIGAATVRDWSRGLPHGGSVLDLGCEWRDSLTHQRSVSLGRERYRGLLEAEGLLLVSEIEDEGKNHYYSAQRPVARIP